MSIKHLTLVEGDAETMMNVGIFTCVIADLISDNTEVRNCDGAEFLSDYRIDGLLKGLKLAGQALCARAEALEEFVEKEEKAQTALARRKGQDNRTESNVEGKCGRAPSA